MKLNGNSVKVGIACASIMAIVLVVLLCVLPRLHP